MPWTRSTRASAGVYALLLASVAVVLFLGLGLAALGPGADPWRRLHAASVGQGLLGFAEVTVGVLGVAITVVSILVELASTRYTPRIAELFVRDRTNVVVLSSFVLTSLLVVWFGLMLGDGPPPIGLVVVVVALLSTSLLMLLPYFAYVFDFLGPEQVVRRIAHLALGAHAAAREGSAVVVARVAFADAVEQLGDVAHRAVQSQDRTIAAAAVRALGEVAREVATGKERLPEAWFDATELLLRDADFASFHPEVVSRLVVRRTWAEAKVLRQLQALYGDALGGMRDTAHLVAIEVRRLAQRAAAEDDREALLLVLRVLHSGLRAAVNQRDVRSAYDAMQELRLLAEALVGTSLQGEVTTIAHHMRSYGVLAWRSGLGFVLETTAYDLGVLLEHLHARGAPEHDGVLSILLEVDREPDDDQRQDAALRGVRKAQIKLATYYLARSAPELARRVAEDLRTESRARLEQLRAELEGTVEPEYWEISDRPTNFDYLPAEQRACLDAFYAWLDA